MMEAWTSYWHKTFSPSFPPPPLIPQPWGQTRLTFLITSSPCCGYILHLKLISQLYNTKGLSCQVHCFTVLSPGLLLLDCFVCEIVEDTHSFAEDNSTINPDGDVKKSRICPPGNTVNLDVTFQNFKGINKAR